MKMELYCKDSGYTTTKTVIKIGCKYKKLYYSVSVLIVGLFMKAISGVTSNTLEIAQNGSSEDKLINDIKIGFNESEVWRNGYCDNPLYILPDFQNQGRRISQVKCLEYLWITKFIEEKERRNKLCNDSDDLNLVGGGRSVPIYEYAHMGAVGWLSAVYTDFVEHPMQDYVFKCGASLISKRYMVTAAHCSRVPKYDVSVTRLEPSIVRLGDEDILREVYHKDVLIERFIVHDKYRSPRKYYDIALIKLKQEVSFNLRIRPACLWSSYDTSPFSSVSVTGWGIDDFVTYTTTSKLQAAEIKLIDTMKCNEMLDSKCNRNWNKTSKHQFCAGHLASGIDTCQGDSGGPLQYKMNLVRSWPMYYLIGVTSFGYNCGRANTPGVYTRIANFIDWIEENVWQ